jgi:hypothetical protein
MIIIILFSVKKCKDESGRIGAKYYIKRRVKKQFDILNGIIPLLKLC